MSTYIDPHNCDTLTHNLTNVPSEQTIATLQITHTATNKQTHTHKLTHTLKHMLRKNTMVSLLNTPSMHICRDIYIPVFKYMCNQYAATHMRAIRRSILEYAHDNTLQQTVAQRNTVQHAAKKCCTPQDTASNLKANRCSIFEYARYNTL